MIPADNASDSSAPPPLSDAPGTAPDGGKPQKKRNRLAIVAFGAGLVVLLVMVVLLRLAAVTDYLYHAAVKDPERTPPAGQVIVAPADGIVLYVRKVTGGIIPEVVKKGVKIPVAEHLKGPPLRPVENGYLVGIYMNTQGVHINRAPDDSIVRKQIVYNGPHLNMSSAEAKIILTQLVPGLVTLRKLLKLPPYAIEDNTDYITKSARETLLLESDQGTRLYIIRIADYYVGKILTWVPEGARVKRGQRLGMITWGSQTDLLFEATPKTTVTVKVGDYVYAGETVIARY